MKHGVIRNTKFINIFPLMKTNIDKAIWFVIPFIYFIYKYMILIKKVLLFKSTKKGFYVINYVI